MHCVSQRRTCSRSILRSPGAPSPQKTVTTVRIEMPERNRSFVPAVCAARSNLGVSELFLCGLRVQRRLHNFGQRRHPEDAHAAGVINGVQDRGVRSCQRRLANTRSPKRTEIARHFLEDDLDVVWNVADVRQPTRLQTGVYLEILEV